MKTNSILRLVLVLGLSGALWVAYTQGQQQQPSKLSVAKIKDDLYVIHNEYVPGNVTALITNEGVVLVDDKFEIDYANIVAEVKKLTDRPIKYVINTHHHGDHSGGNARMQQLNVQIVASEQAREHMVDAKQPGLPNITIDRRAQIHLGGKKVEIYYFGRAHTNGDVVAYFPAHRALAAGDMFTYGDATPQLIDYAGGGSAKEWTKTLDSVLQLDFDTVVPGHGVVTTKQEMAKFRESTVALRNRIRQLILEKKSRDEIAKVMQTEFHWAQLHIDRSLDGAMVELR